MILVLWLNTGMHMELDYVDLGERFRTRVLYSSADTYADYLNDLQEASGLEKDWKDLVDEAENVDWQLEDTKKKFSATTRQEARISQCESSDI